MYRPIGGLIFAAGVVMALSNSAPSPRFPRRTAAPSTVPHGARGRGPTPHATTTPVMTWQFPLSAFYVIMGSRLWLLTAHKFAMRLLIESNVRAHTNSKNDMENDDQHQIEGQEEIPLDETTDALLQAIADAPDDGLDELVQNLPLDVDALMWKLRQADHFLWG
jgi:hypothetical protein